MTDGFAVCPKHGDIFWDPGARWGDALEAHRMLLATELPTIYRRPSVGDETLCPVIGVGMLTVCRLPLNFEIRRTVTRV